IEMNKEEKEIDLAVLEYMRKRGYANSEAIFRQESNIVATGSDSSAIELDKGNIAQYLLFYNQQEHLNPQKYLESYVKLRNWIHQSLDIYKQEFLSILYPIFVHCYIDLISKGYPSQAFELMEKLGPEHEDYYDEDLKLLRGIRNYEHLKENELASTFRNNSWNLKMCAYSFELLMSFLHESKFILIISIINQYFNIKLKKKKLTKEEVERQSRSKSNVPLPKFNDAFEAELGNDIAKCVSLSAASLPSICCYTFFNTYQGLNSVEISKDASLVVGGFSDSSLRLWNLKELASKRESSRTEEDDEASSSSSTKNKTAAPLEGDDPNNRMRSSALDSDFRTFIGHSGPVYGCSMSPDNQFILSCSEDNSARLWSMETMSNLVAYKGHNYPIWDVSFSPYGYYFATASHDKTARLWCTNYISPMRIFAGHLSDVNCVRFHPNINYLATGSSDKSARLWECNTGKCVRIFMGHRAPIYSVSISPDGKYLATAGEDTSVVLWDLASGKKIKKMDGHTKTVYSLDFSMDSTILASASADCTVRLWDVNKACSQTSLNNDDSTTTKTPSKKSRLKQRRSPELMETYPTKQTPVFNVNLFQTQSTPGLWSFHNEH
ncbi:hypothetical protein SAMD00019534_021670, partial [Acytostelium subglobosum LB1]|uniref:hypothetical protein n=1 Tax=Acytostelium subglobosum LB1 TaxID=1410327 RepID=UPI000644B09C